MSSTGADGEKDLPPPIPPAEMSREDLALLVDEGNLMEVERALREQVVRLPVVLEELNRVVAAGLGNLATAMVTMLISRFHVARADKLADRVLSLRATAGVEELVDLAAALIQQERLSAARRALDAALEKDERHGRGLYLLSRTLARKGDLGGAFEMIARVDPNLLGANGLLTQARYAALTGRKKAIQGAMKLAKKRITSEDEPLLGHVERLLSRIDLAGIDPSQPMSLRTAMAVEYGSLLVEVAKEKADSGRFGMDVMKLGDVGRTLERMVDAIRKLGLPLSTLYYANEDGEIIAAAIAEKTGLDFREWRHERSVDEGTWLCMASAGTHPHQKRIDVDALSAELDKGVMRTLALMLPVGWRAPIVPDVVGRLTGDDELPWAIDDEVDETVDLIFDDREDRAEDAAEDDDALATIIERFGGILRATRPAPHVPFLDETPVPRG